MYYKVTQQQLVQLDLCNSEWILEYKKTNPNTTTTKYCVAKEISNFYYIIKDIVTELYILEYEDIVEFLPSDWHEDTNFQIFLTHKDNTILIKEVSAIYEYWKDNDIDTYIEDSGVYLYVNYLLDEHRTLLLSYNAVINEKPN